jgi:hypothetical protein
MPLPLLARPCRTPARPCRKPRSNSGFSAG